MKAWALALLGCLLMFAQADADETKPAVNTQTLAVNQLLEGGPDQPTTDQPTKTTDDHAGPKKASDVIIGVMIIIFMIIVVIWFWSGKQGDWL